VKINCCVGFGLWGFKWTLVAYLGFAVHCLWLHNWRMSPFNTFVERMWFDNLFQSIFHVSLEKNSYMKVNMGVEDIHNVQCWGPWFSHWGLFKFPFCLKNSNNFSRRQLWEKRARLFQIFYHPGAEIRSFCVGGEIWNRWIPAQHIRWKREQTHKLSRAHSLVSAYCSTILSYMHKDL